MDRDAHCAAGAGEVDDVWSPRHSTIMRAPTLDTSRDIAPCYPTNSAGVAHICALEVACIHERCADVVIGHCTVSDGLLLHLVGEDGLAGGVRVKHRARTPRNWTESAAK